jgi:hypothetical protein
MVRAAERDSAARAEAIYRRMVASWQPARPARKPPKPKVIAMGVAASKGTRL